MSINNMLDENAMAQLSAMLEQDAANPAPPEEEPELEENENPDEVDTVNETISGLSEGETEQEVPEEENPNAPAETQQTPPAPELPDGAQSVEQLIEMYNMLKAGTADIAALRDMNAQLVSIAEALGYGKDVESVDLSVDDNDPASAAKAEIHKIFSPMIEQQQKQIRQKMIDSAWKTFEGDHADAADMMDDIRAMINADESLQNSEHGMEAAYHLIRSQRYKPEAALFDDEAFIEKAARNQKVYDRVVEDYLKNVAKGGENAPKGLGSTGSIASSGKKKAPMTLEEANRAAAKLFGG